MAIKFIKLTPDQKKCVDFIPEGELLIRGIPGAGKTTVLLERALYLKSREKSNGVKDVIFLTFNKALSTYIRQLARESSEKEAIEALTFHSWGAHLLQDIGKLGTRNIGNEQEEVVKIAKRTIVSRTGANFPKMKGKLASTEEYYLVKFLKEEFSWMKNNDILTREKYLDCVRTGRGSQVQVTKAHRESIYTVFEKYQHILRGKNAHDFDDIALLLLKHADSIPIELRPMHVLIDEAQDLSPAQFKAIKKLVMKSLTIAADKGQQIYRRTFTWKSVNIEVRGSRNKVLNRSFRSTKQIIKLARSLQMHDKILIQDDEFLPAQDPDTEGPLPELLISSTVDEEIQHVIRKIKLLRKGYSKDTIGVIGYSWKVLDVIGDKLRVENIEPVLVKENSANFVLPGVKLATYQSSKGLEFDHVIVIGLQDGKLPDKIKDLGDDPDAYLATERRKLYVAMTRARLTLTLSALTPLSPFIRELDSNLYK
jgi:superfamily I DNA/RNA helicase